MSKWLWTLTLILIPHLCQATNENTHKKSDRVRRLLPVFQVVRFPNDVCIVEGGSKNGTCYTEEECTNKGGTTQGSCAEGFGVCCVFTLGCGQESNENCTYFELANKAIQAGACQSRFCKINQNICQLRLDFENFVLTGPSTSTLTVGLAIGGEIAGSGTAVAPATLCLTDTFAVSNQLNLPLICGTMSGEHVYVDASDMCNDLVFQFGTTAVGVTSIATRSFSVKVTQYNCAYENKAPTGCDQYFFGPSGTGIVKTFNYDGGYHLSGQDQTICFRREKNNCRLCLSADAEADVKISGKATKGTAKAELCCAYGTDGKGTFYDCLVIPGAVKAADSKAMNGSQCGGNKGLFSTAAGAQIAATTVCTKAMPFQIQFLSDQYEFTDESKAGAGILGFKLRYFQTSC